MFLMHVAHQTLYSVLFPYWLMQLTTQGEHVLCIDTVRYYRTLMHNYLIAIGLSIRKTVQYCLQARWHSWCLSKIWEHLSPVTCILYLQCMILFFTQYYTNTFQGLCDTNKNIIINLFYHCMQKSCIMLQYLFDNLVTINMHTCMICCCIPRFRLEGDIAKFYFFRWECLRTID